MLVLRRRAGEAIVLGGEIEIEVIEISRTRVKLGVKAPKSVTVSRREVQALASDNLSACALLPSCGADSLEQFAKLFRDLSVPNDKVSAENADM